MNVHLISDGGQPWCDPDAPVTELVTSNPDLVTCDECAPAAEMDRAWSVALVRRAASEVTPAELAALDGAEL